MDSRPGVHKIELYRQPMQLLVEKYQPGYNNNYCFSCDRSISYQDIPDVLRISYRYELPFGVGKPHVNRGVAARVIGGWSIAGFISADNGVPITVTSPADFFTYFGGGNGQRPTATGKPAKLDDRQYVDGAAYFNAAAFTRTAPFTFGNVSRSFIRCA